MMRKDLLLNGASPLKFNRRYWARTTKIKILQNEKFYNNHKSDY